MGREYITLSNNDIQVELGFDGICEENLVFDAVVINNSGNPLSYNPSDFYYVLLDSANADTSSLPPRMAVHPEKILHQYDETLAANSIENGIIAFFEMVEIAFEKGVIQEEILRTGQIPPGKVANGFVFFPRYSDHGFLMFCFPFEDQLFQFVYHQHQDPIH